MWAAANTKGGVAGVPQSVGQDFAAADEPGKLPEHKTKPSRSSRMYGKKKVSR